MSEALGADHKAPLHNPIKSFRELRKSKLVQIEKAGAFYKARFAGKSHFVFGSSKEDALQRLGKGMRRVNESD